MTCRHEIIESFRRLRRRHGRDTFTPLEIIQEVQAVTTRYAESTIRTHVCAHMCKQAPVNAAVVYNALDRVGHGRYRLRSGGTCS